MLNKKSVDDMNAKGKRVLIRCDFNVPLKDGVITDENRLVQNLAVLRDVARRSGAKILLAQKAFSMFSTYPLLREYLAGRYNFQAMEMTSAEIIARIRELSVEERASKRLGSLLEVADFVKFAKYEPDAVQNEDAYQDAYYFVEETKQLPPELQPQQAGNDTPQGNVPGPTGTSGGLKPSGVPGAPDIPDTPGGAAAGGTSDEAGEGKEVRS